MLHKCNLFFSFKENFRHIDYEIPLRVIKLARTAGVGHCSLVSSKGANLSSWLLYFSTKGQMEASAVEEKFEYTSIFRPGVLNRGQSRRTLEKISCKLCD